MSSLAAYLEVLREELGGKDPRGLKKAVRGSIVLLLRDPAGELEKATVRVEKDAVTIHAGNTAPSGEPRLVVRGEVGDWIAYVEKGDATAAARLEMYGDAGPMRSLAETLALSRSANAVRFGRFQ